MATEFHAFAAGAWRKAKALHYNQGGTWRTIKEAWRNVGGTWVKVFSAAGFVPDLGLLNADHFAAVPYAELKFFSDGDILCTGNANGAYYLPLTAGIGATCQVRLTNTGGNATPQGGVGTWQNLNATPTFYLTTGGNQGTRQALGTVEVRRISDLSIVCTGTYAIEVTDFA